MNKQAWLTDRDYNFIYSRVPRLCVDLLIKKGKSVLLTKRNIEPGKNTWHLPGGRVRFGEFIDSAGRRIAKQELGVSIRLVKLLGFMEFPREKQSNNRRHSVSLIFFAEVIGVPLQEWDNNIHFFKNIPAETYFGHAKFLKSRKILK